MSKVLCTVCEHELRKSVFDLKRHWEKHHKARLEGGQKPSWKFPSKGLGSLDNFFYINDLLSSNTGSVPYWLITSTQDLTAQYHSFV